MCAKRGSWSDTVAVAEAFAKRKGERDKLVIGHFEWCNDWAAARNYAESLATGEFVCNTDLDEIVVGAENLRRCCEKLTPDVGSMTGVNMVYFQTCYYGQWNYWERLSRRGAFPWERRVAKPGLYAAGSVP